MVSAHVFRATAAAVLLLAAPSAGWAQQASPPTPVTSATASPGPFARNAIGVEVGAGFFTEAWNSNGTHEWIGEGTFAVSWAFKEGAALVVEFHAAGIAQTQPRTAFLNGLAPVLRWRVLTRGASSMFIDLGAGVSWSDTTVPPRGTRFNYMLIAGAGLTHQLSRQVYAVASARLIHLSNASLMGPNHNPDIEALGGYFGLHFAF